MSGATRSSGLWSNRWLLALACILVVLPWAVNPFRVRIFTLWGIYAIAATGLTLFTGFTGQISLGQAAFFGIGAYSSALLTKAGVPFPIAIVAAGLVAAFCGMLIGFPALRARTFYLAMITLAFGLSMTIIFKNWTGVTGGVSGIGAIPAPSLGPILLDGYMAYYYTVWVVVALVLLLAHRLGRSYLGLTFRGISDSEVAAESLAVNVYLCRLISFLFCTFLAGVAGCLYSNLDRVISPESFTSEESIIFLAMAVIGGLRSTYGGLIGAMVFTLIGEQLRSMERGQIIIIGALLVLLVIFLPQGAVGLPERIGRLFRHKETAVGG